MLTQRFKDGRLFKKEVSYMLTYAPMLKLMIDRKISKSQLKEDMGLSTTTAAKFSKDQPVSMEMLNRLCAYFNCSIQDIIEYHPDEQ